jgi:hypothetical protein
MFFEGYISQNLDSAEVSHGIGIFCRFFALKDFLSYRPLKKVWADPPTAVRFRVNGGGNETDVLDMGGFCGTGGGMYMMYWRWDSHDVLEMGCAVYGVYWRWDANDVLEGV